MKALDNLMALEGCSTVIELSEKTGIAKGTLDMWNFRGRIPTQAARKLSAKYGKPVDWFSVLDRPIDAFDVPPPTRRIPVISYQLGAGRSQRIF